MTGDLFRAVREAVDARDAAERYGLRLDRAGRALCPFHNDHHPSMSFKHGRFRCWACGAAGDCIVLTARLLGLTPVEALGRLNTDFGLGLPLHREPTAQERKAAERRRKADEEQRAFAAWREEFIIRLNNCIRVALDILRGGKPLEELNDFEVVAVQRAAWFEFLADALQDGTEAEQMRIYANRKEAERWMKIAESADKSRR